MGSYDRRLLRDLKSLGYRAVHTSDRRPAKAGAWLQPRFSVVATDTGESVREYARMPSAVGRLGGAAKSVLKRVR